MGPSSPGHGRPMSNALLIGGRPSSPPTVVSVNPVTEPVVPMTVSPFTEASTAQTQDTASMTLTSIWNDTSGTGGGNFAGTTSGSTTLPTDNRGMMAAIAQQQAQQRRGSVDPSSIAPKRGTSVTNQKKQYQSMSGAKLMSPTGSKTLMSSPGRRGSKPTVLSDQQPPGVNLLKNRRGSLPVATAGFQQQRALPNNSPSTNVTQSPTTTAAVPIKTSTPGTVPGGPKKRATSPQSVLDREGSREREKPIVQDRSRGAPLEEEHALSSTLGSGKDTSGGHKQSRRGSLPGRADMIGTYVKFDEALEGSIKRSLHQSGGGIEE